MKEGFILMVTVCDATPFYDWIIRFKGIDSAIGDLADDIISDPSFPKDINSLEALLKHIESKSRPFRVVHADVVSATERAWAFYLLENGLADLVKDKIVPIKN